jgi:hypothetical protein
MAALPPQPEHLKLGQPANDAAPRERLLCAPVVVAMDNQRRAAQDGGGIDPEEAVFMAARCFVADKDINVQPRQAADVFRENRILPSQVGVETVGWRELADEMFSRSKVWVNRLEPGIPDLLVKNAAQTSDDHAADLSPRPVQVALGVVSPKVVMERRGIDVVVSWNPSDADARIEEGLQLLPQWRLEIAVSQDHNAVGSLGGAGFEQWQPIAVRVAVDYQAAHGGVRLPFYKREISICLTGIGQYTRIMSKNSFVRSAHWA